MAGSPVISGRPLGRVVGDVERGAQAATASASLASGGDDAMPSTNRTMPSAADRVTVRDGRHVASCLQAAVEPRDVRQGPRPFRLQSRRATPRLASAALILVAIQPWRMAA